MQRNFIIMPTIPVMGACDGNADYERAPFQVEEDADGEIIKVKLIVGSIANMQSVILSLFFA